MRVGVCSHMRVYVQGVCTAIEQARQPRRICPIVFMCTGFSVSTLCVAGIRIGDDMDLLWGGVDAAMPG